MTSMPRVLKSCGDHLRAPVVPIEPGLRDEHADFPIDQTLPLAAMGRGRRRRVEVTRGKARPATTNRRAAGLHSGVGRGTLRSRMGGASLRIARRVREYDDVDATSGVSHRTSVNPRPRRPDGRRRDKSQSNTDQPGGVRRHRRGYAVGVRPARLPSSRALPDGALRHTAALDDRAPSAPRARRAGAGGGHPRVRYDDRRSARNDGVRPRPLRRTVRSIVPYAGRDAGRGHRRLDGALWGRGVATPRERFLLAQPAFRSAPATRRQPGSGPRQRLSDHPHDGLHAVRGVQLPDQDAGGVRRGRGGRGALELRTRWARRSAATSRSRR